MYHRVSTCTCTVVTMATIQFLTILLVVTCFLGGVVSVTDRQFEDLVSFVHQQAAIVEEQSETIKELLIANEQQSIRNEQLSVTVHKQSASIELMTEKIKRQQVLINELATRGTREGRYDALKLDDDLIQNLTIEERVAILEGQVMVIQDDVTGLDQDVNFLFDETVIQDERLSGLEQAIFVIDEDIEGLLATTIALDFRVTTLEENGGSDGNNSVAELEVRVETLEGTTADHETRISAAETDINNLETRLTAAEENVQGLQMTDVELDDRVTALEENVGGFDNDTIGFNAALTSYSSIPDESAVVFNEVLLNERDGYDSTTGTFTVPPGGDGYYYFSVFLFVRNDENGYFDIQINGETLCSPSADQQDTPGDPGQSACGATTYAVEGDEVQVVYRSGTDTTPLYVATNYYWNGFTGFRI